MKKNICVVVLGDIGRSPRMQYHSRSFAEEGHRVDIVGYMGAPPIESLSAQPLVSYHYLNPYVFNLPVVQNPPAVPTLFCCYLYKLITKAKLVIDWHNYAHTILALSLRPNHCFIGLTESMEHFFGRRADFNFCVTNEMRKDLEGWGIKAVTLYDRPPEIFRSIDVNEKRKQLTSFMKKYKTLLPDSDPEWEFTKEENGETVFNERRPALLVSSTSWTEDEDFAVLIAALQDYENLCNLEKENYPNLICVITGKGPLKEYYREQIKTVQWKNIIVLTPWLESKDYPLLLASADIGVSLHTSSSGLDLPMKVVDMFGSGLPVCAYNFRCLNELVKHEINGYVFSSSKELFEQLRTIFENFPNNDTQNSIVDNMKEEIETFQRLRWSENWTSIVKPIIK